MNVRYPISVVESHLKILSLVLLDTLLIEDTHIGIVTFSKITRHSNTAAVHKI